MRVVQDSLDDLLFTVYQRLLKQKRHAAKAPTKGPNVELIGAQLVLRNPLARLSRAESRNLLFGQLGELLWYLSGKDRSEIIKYYLKNYPLDKEEDPAKVRSAYGPRLLQPGRVSELQRIVDLLRANPPSRRAVIPIYWPIDTLPHPDVPCTCTLQFMNRGGRLIMVTHMRSNDVWLGLPGDIFAFTMIQELIARSLGLKVGPYHHLVGSLHLYDKHRKSAEAFVSEGFQYQLPMPAMPLGDQSAAVREVLKAEILIRRGRYGGSTDHLPQYWADIIRLLQIHAAYGRKDQNALRRIRRRMRDSVYNTYIERRKRVLETKTEIPVDEIQMLNLNLDGGDLVH
ncbi:thymidylate synthase [Terriglobus sp.]|uniref:thymidylate synthase n=1 Tax=Terriglobus sp. TaxID=1889013 RepID=UPI003AFFD113